MFNIALGIVSWWTSKESERYNRLIQLRVFAFCVNILHAYITGPIIYQNDDAPLLAPGIIQINRIHDITKYLVFILFVIPHYLYTNDVESKNQQYFLGRIIGLFRLSYLTPGLMAAGVTEVILEKEQDQNSDGETEDDNGKGNKKADKTEGERNSSNSSSKSDSKSGSKKSK